jgi:2-polyprenyl-3-methyl-5-hydroxy-6-metoxy-1,4-benzoquinol methylase
LPDIRDKQVLDLGCGTGRLSRWLAKRGATVLGIDFSEKSIAIATRESSGSNPAYRTQSMFDLDDSDSYDVIVSWGSITVACRDAREVRDVMLKLRQSLKPKGMVVLLEPIHSGFLHRVLDMNLAEFTSIMRTSGLEVQSHKSMHFWPARLALAFISWPNWATVPVYRLGQAAMRIPGLRHWGDYTAICAVAA